MEQQEQNNEKFILAKVLSEIKQLKKKLCALETHTVLESLNLPEEDFRALGILVPGSIKKSRGRHPILESEIKEVQLNSSSAMECAKKLGVSYPFYKKWAKKYGIFKTNPWIAGNKKTRWVPDNGKHPLNQILDGKFPEYPIYRLKDIIIRSGTKPAKCENCGFDEHRITDHKIPLLISFKDGNEKNHRLENIELLCYNCMFLIGRGYIHKGKVEFNFLDLDTIQGSARKIQSQF